jgi:hypothetical protein
MLRKSLNVKNTAELSNVVPTLVYTRHSMLEIPYKYKSVSKPFPNVQGSDSIKTHIGENLYKCTQVKVFNQSSNLTELQRIHTGEKSYKYSGQYIEHVLNLYPKLDHS